MNKIYRLLRYDWPLHFVLVFTNWLPDNILFLRLRGSLASLFFGRCGKNLRLGRNVTFYNPSKIELGNWVYIAYGSWFHSGHPIVINDEIMFGPYCIVTTDNHTILDGSYRFGKTTGAEIVIGKGTWIGGHCTIVKGVVLGEGCLVAANSIVTKSFTNLSKVGGNPAKLLS